MFKASIKPYRFNALELFLLERVGKMYIGKDYYFNRWPEVYFGNFDDFPNLKPDKEILTEIDYNLNDIDYLGHYVFNHTEEGHIRIYKDRIELCSNRIAKNLDLNTDNVMNYLLTIVLIHEIGHWFTHFCHTHNRNIRLQGFASQEKIIKETLAQLTVVWSIWKLKTKDIKNLRTVFDYLVDHQSYPYREFRKLGKKQTYVNTLLSRYGYIADDHQFNFGYDFNYFLYGDKIYKKSKSNSIL